MSEDQTRAAYEQGYEDGKNKEQLEVAHVVAALLLSLGARSVLIAEETLREMPDGKLHKQWYDNGEVQGWQYSFEPESRSIDPTELS